MNCKIWIALIAVTIAVYKDGVTLSSMTLPGSSFWGIEMNTLVCEDTGSVVDCGTQAVKATVCPSYSTGPFMPMCVSTNTATDCYTADGIWSNGDFVNKHWVQHPL